MINQSNTAIPSLYKSLSRTAGIITILVGSMVLLGWALDIPVLKSILPGFATMKANTAFAFVLSGMALWLVLKEPVTQRTRYAVQTFAFIIALLGLFTLCEYIFRWQLGIDQWLFKDLGGGIGNLTPGRMSPTTALNFLLLGVAFLLLSRETALGIRTAQFLGLLTIILSGVALLGYLYGATVLYGIGAYNQIAAHTALTFIVVSAGLLCSRPDSGMMSILTGGNTGSFTARRLLPMALVVPVILGWLRLQGQRAGFYDTELGLAIMVSSSTVVFVILIAWNAVWLNRVDAELKREQTSGLRQNEERLRYVTWATRDAVWDRDLVTGDVWWNEGLQKLCHYRADQIEPNVNWWTNHVHPEDRDKVVRSIQTILETRQHLWSKEYRFERADGSYANIFDRGYILYDEQTGEPLRMIGAMADLTEQKTIEKALRQSEELFAKAFSASPAGIILTRKADGRMIEVNDSYLKIVGYTRREVLGQTTLELGVISAEDRARLLQVFDEQGTVRDFEYWTRTKSGQLRAVLSSLEQVEVEGDACFLAVIYDITERKQAEAAQQQSEALFRTLFELSPDAVVVIDPHDPNVSWPIIDCNAVACQMNGYDRDELIGHSIDILNGTPGTRAERNAYLKLLRKTGSIKAEFRHRHKSGVMFPIETATTLIVIGGRELVIGIDRDITARKQVEEALAEQAIQLSDQAALLNLTHETVIVRDMNSAITFWNRGAEEMYGWTQAQALGKITHSFLKTRFPGSSDDVKAELLWAGRWDGELIHTTQDGRKIVVVSRQVIKLDEHGQSKEILEINTDITERKQAEDALQQANEKLKRGVAELDQRNREIVLLNELGNLLQTCNSLEDADAIISQLAPKVFPDTPGALYMMDASGAQLEAVSAWEMLSAQKHAFLPQDCLALERKQSHFADANHPKSQCPHVSDASCSSVCIPLIAQHGQVIGVFHLERSQNKSKRPVEVQEGFTPSERELVKAVADTIALALTNLKLRETLRTQAIRDPLTGLYNRRFMEESLEREMSRAKRNQLPLGIMMLDLDHFKDFNDTFGHEAGDAVLRELSSFLQASIRAGDIACRYGGEEFLLILPEASLENTRLRAQKLCEDIRSIQVQHRGEILAGITFSVGVAVFPEHGQQAEDVIRAADAALYRAKKAGRNRVAVARRAAKKPVR